MKRIVVCTAVAMSLVAGSAHAGWQFSQWGMSPKQVVAASKGKATPLDAAYTEARQHRDQRPLLGMNYTSGNYKFIARFSFTKPGDELKTVVLDLLDKSRCMGLMIDLNAKYGAGEVERLGMLEVTITKWKDKSSNSRLQITEYDKDGQTQCDLAYSPLISDDNKGL